MMMNTFSYPFWLFVPLLWRSIYNMNLGIIQTTVLFGLRGGSGRGGQEKGLFNNVTKSGYLGSED